MKHHLYLGLAILVALLVLGLVSTACLTRTSRSMEDDLLCAWEAASGEELHTAWNCAQRAKSTWERVWPLMACMMDHEKLQTVDQEFAELEAQYRVGDSGECARLCLILAQRIRGMGEEDWPAFYNILAIFVNFHKVFV